MIRLETLKVKYIKKDNILKIKNELMQQTTTVKYNGHRAEIIYFLEKYLKTQGFEIFSYTDMYDRGLFIHAQFNKELKEYKEYKKQWKQFLGI